MLSSWLGFLGASKAVTPMVKGADSFTKNYLPHLRQAIFEKMKRVGEPLAERIQAPILRKKVMREFNDAATGRRQKEWLERPLAKLKRWDVRKRGPREIVVAPPFSDGPIQQTSRPENRDVSGTQAERQERDRGINDQHGGSPMEPPKTGLTKEFQTATKSNTGRTHKPDFAPPRKDLAPPGDVGIPAPGGGGMQRSPKREVPPLTPPRSAEPTKMDNNELKKGVRGEPVAEHSKLKNHFNPKSIKR